MTSSELIPLYDIKIWRIIDTTCTDITSTFTEIIEDVISIKVALNVENRPGTATVIWENDPPKDIREGDVIEIWMGWEKADETQDIQKVFSGEIQDAKGGSQDEIKTLRVEAKDWSFLFLVDKITSSYPAPTNVKTIVETLLATYLQAGVPGACEHKVRNTKIEATAKTRILDFVGEPLIDCVAKCNHVSDHDSYVDPEKEFNWFAKLSRSSGYTLTKDDLENYLHEKPYDLICNKANVYGKNNKPIPWDRDAWTEAITNWAVLDASWTSISEETSEIRWGSKAVKVTVNQDPDCVFHDYTNWFTDGDNFWKRLVDGFTLVTNTFTTDGDSPWIDVCGSGWIQGGPGDVIDYFTFQDCVSTCSGTLTNVKLVIEAQQEGDPGADIAFYLDVGAGWQLAYTINNISGAWATYIGDVTSIVNTVTKFNACKMKITVAGEAGEECKIRCVWLTIGATSTPPVKCDYYPVPATRNCFIYYDNIYTLGGSVSYIDTCCTSGGANDCDCDNGGSYPECCYFSGTAPEQGVWQGDPGYTTGFFANIPAKAGEVIVIRRIKFKYHVSCEGGVPLGQNTGAYRIRVIKDPPGGDKITTWSSGGTSTGNDWRTFDLQYSDQGMPIWGDPSNALYLYIDFTNLSYQCVGAYACVEMKDVEIYWNYSKSCSQKLGAKYSIPSADRVDLSTKQAPQKLRFSIFPHFKLSQPGTGGYPKAKVILHWAAGGTSTYELQFQYLENNRWSDMEVPLGNTNEGWTNGPPNKGLVSAIEFELPTGIASAGDYVIFDWLHYDEAKWFGTYQDAGAGSSQETWGIKFKEIFDDTCYSDEQALRVATEHVKKYKQLLDVLRDVIIDYDNQHKLHPGETIIADVPELTAPTVYRISEIVHELTEDFEYLVHLTLSDPPTITTKAASLTERARKLEQEYYRKPSAPGVETD